LRDRDLILALGGEPDRLPGSVRGELNIESDALDSHRTFLSVSTGRRTNSTLIELRQAQSQKTTTTPNLRKVAGYKHGTTALLAKVGIELFDAI
jgi:hypothetical protein